MKNKNWNDALGQDITSALQRRAKQIEVSEKTRQDILAKIETLEGANVAMKPMKKSRKLVMAVAAACILTCTTAVAASGFFGMTGHNILGSETYSVQDAQEKTEKTLGFAPIIPESFTGEFKFASSYESQWQGADETGNPIGEFYDMVTITYENNNKEQLNYIIDEYSLDRDNRLFSATKEINGVTVYYHSYVQKIVPPDYQPTAEDEARQAAGGFNLAYGGDQVEEHVIQSVFWQTADGNYEIMGSDVSLTADELFAMAGEVLA